MLRLTSLLGEQSRFIPRLAVLPPYMGIIPQGTGQRAARTVARLGGLRSVALTPLLTGENSPDIRGENATAWTGLSILMIK